VQGKVVRLARGRLEEAKVYFEDPVEAARKWMAEGADAIHVVDVEAAMGVGDNLSVVKKILSATNVEVQVAGGVRSLERAEELIKLGAARVVVGTRFVEDPEWLSQLVAKLGGRRVVVALDHRGGLVAIKGWTKQTALSVEELAREAERRGAGWLLVTSIERDGMLTGLDTQTLRRAVAAVKLPVIAAGGVKGVHDVVSAARAGAAGIILGRALYEGRVRLSEAARALVEAGLR
ncbi:MAG: 1-(5-phosphoribosyl)-5-[(5-phosphoribosylamino)methylideneamino] imidazole-4-carboxamide isomerase, partial [Candidatus Nezhaarchaeota archaeon]|nr:1-(5-phosphoribosyl)-5-[(5-phosphoribosylamino)methylideneamino] imidazole-4-carboxamide isomerase [Candidatus Nezhaarchaeota archaeon]